MRKFVVLFSDTVTNIFDVNMIDFVQNMAISIILPNVSHYIRKMCTDPFSPVKMFYEFFMSSPKN